MKNNPLVSIIMSEYNTEIDLLKKSITSILNQTYDNFEFIIIDDCGKNQLSEIVKEFNDKRIKVYKNDTNKGLVYSLNKALNKAKGKYIVRMDTDDWSYPDRISKQVAFMESNDYDVVGANVVFYDGKKEWGKTNNSGIVTRKQLLLGTTLVHPTVIAKKEALINVNGYRDYKRCEDYALWIELYSQGYKLYVMEDILLKYHLSIEDYKKRSFKTRKGFFKLLRTQYNKLNPSLLNKITIYSKNIIAGLVPHKIIYLFHKSKNNRNGD